MSFSVGTKLEMTRCHHCAIRHHSVCGALKEEELFELNKIARQKHFKAGETIVSDTEAADFFANIVSGVVKLSKTMSDGRQQIVGLLFSPDFLGRAYRTHHTYFAEAATDVTLCSFPHNAFETILKKFPELEHRLFAHTLDELDSAREWMLLLGRKTAAEKVANFLYILAKRSHLQGCSSPNEDTASFAIPLTRADMADYLGLTIETVSRQMTKLKKNNVILMQDNRYINVIDMNLLSSLSGHEEI